MKQRINPCELVPISRNEDSKHRIARGTTSKSPSGPIVFYCLFLVPGRARKGGQGGTTVR